MGLVVLCDIMYRCLEVRVPVDDQGSPVGDQGSFGHPSTSPDSARSASDFRAPFDAHDSSNNWVVAATRQPLGQQARSRHCRSADGDNDLTEPLTHYAMQ